MIGQARRCAASAAPASLRGRLTSGTSTAAGIGVPSRPGRRKPSFRSARGRRGRARERLREPVALGGRRKIEQRKWQRPLQSAVIRRANGNYSAVAAPAALARDAAPGPIERRTESAARARNCGANQQQRRAAEIRPRTAGSAPSVVYGAGARPATTRSRRSRPASPPASPPRSMPRRSLRPRRLPM